MNKKDYKFSFDVYGTSDELNDADKVLLDKARKVTEQAYAPYSNFWVGAAAKLVNGEVVTGTNQENASYPVGICAERVLLSAVSTLFPNVAIDTMAIAYHSLQGKSNVPVSPCGMCRQALLEYQNRTQKSIRLILSGLEDEVIIIERADLLLPLSFTGENLK